MIYPKYELKRIPGEEARVDTVLHHERDDRVGPVAAASQAHTMS